MGHPTVKGRSTPARLTRRDVLRGAVGLASAWMARSVGAGQTIALPGPVELARDAAQPWWVEEFPGRSLVVDIRSGAAVQAGRVDRGVLGRMLDQGVAALADTGLATQAWRRILGRAERIALKFNAVGAEVVRTNDVLADAILSSLESAGYSSRSVCVVEAMEQDRPGALRTVRTGWGPPIVLDGQEEPLAAWLHDADALISVGTLKTHPIAGISGCMKNVSHAVVRRPARYHRNGCSPYVGVIVGSQPVRSRLKLNILSALRVVLDKGPDAEPGDVHDYGALLLGFDPVAVDAIGLDILAGERRRVGLRSDIDVPYLVSAAALNVGRAAPEAVGRLTLELGM